MLSLRLCYRATNISKLNYRNGSGGQSCGVLYYGDILPDGRSKLPPISSTSSLSSFLYSPFIELVMSPHQQGFTQHALQFLFEYQSQPTPHFNRLPASCLKARPTLFRTCLLRALRENCISPWRPVNKPPKPPSS